MTTLTTGIPCVICGQPLIIGLAKGRKSGKVFVELRCKQGRHFRGFISDRDYVDAVLARLEGHISGSGSEGDEQST